MIEYRGISGMDLTTAGNLFDAEYAFFITDSINKDRPRQKWIGLEIYPMRVSPLFLWLRKIRIGRSLIPESISAEKILLWLEKYPNTRVERIHLPFAYNIFESLKFILFGKKNWGIRERVYELAWIFLMGTASSRFISSFLKTLQKNGVDVGINAHSNIAEGFAHSGRLVELRGLTKYIYVEKERLFRANQEQISDPVNNLDAFVKTNSLDGVILGIDHATEEGSDLVRVLRDPKLQRHIRAIHFSKSKHGVIEKGDESITRFLDALRNTAFDHPVRGALDYNPFVFGKYTKEQQLALVKETIEWIEKQGSSRKVQKQ